MSMLLFVLCVDPLLRILNQKLPGIRIGNRARKTVVVAYADDITIFVTTPTDVPVISDAIQCYEKNHGSSPEDTEIDGTSGGRMEYFQECAEHNMPR